jgi:hypothetical protein
MGLGRVDGGVDLALGQRDARPGPAVRDDLDLRSAQVGQYTVALLLAL